MYRTPTDRTNALGIFRRRFFRGACLRRPAVAAFTAGCLALGSAGCAADVRGFAGADADDLLVHETAGVGLMWAIKGGLGAIALPLLGAAVVGGGAFVYFRWSGQKAAKRYFADALARTLLLVDVSERLPAPSKAREAATRKAAVEALREGTALVAREKAEGATRHLEQTIHASRDQRLSRYAVPPLDSYQANALNPATLQLLIVRQVGNALSPEQVSAVRKRWLGMSDERALHHLRLALASHGETSGALDAGRLGRSLAYYLGTAAGEGGRTIATGERYPFSESRTRGRRVEPPVAAGFAGVSCGG